MAFGQMVSAGGAYRGERIVAPELVAAMTADQLTPEQRDRGGPILDGRGWGFGLSVIDPPTVAGGGPKGYGWSGGFGTVWVNDPEEDLVAVLCTQVLSPTDGALEAAFWSAAYQALEG
jgi:CubicO group peptidase (beta-lactamase class C family)